MAIFVLADLHHQGDLYVAILEFPRPLLWADRVSSMPYIAGGGDAQLDSLRTLLLRVQEDGAAIETVQAVDRSRPRGFVERDGRRRWQVTAAGQQWLETSDHAFLVGVFHSEIKFVGELLEVLAAGSLTHTQLVEVAKAEYDLEWGSADQTRRRTTWLRAAGFLDLRFDNLLVPTDEGLQLLSRLDNHAPNSLRGDTSSVHASTSVDLPAPPPLIKQALAAQTQNSLQTRRRLIGYMPVGSSTTESIRKMVSVAIPHIDKDGWIAACERHFELKATTAAQSIGSFRGAGLTEQIDRDVDAASPLAKAWLESDDDINLIRVVHLSIRFFGEILRVLEVSESSADLTARALEYNIPAPDLQRRVGLLLAVGLVEEAGVRRLRLSPAGHALLRELPLEKSPESSAAPSNSDSLSINGKNDDSPDSHALALEKELRAAARAASDHKRLELAVAGVLASIGFDVEHLGGQGRTDVRAESTTAGQQHYVLIADAKASAKGQVAPFDVVTLREHKEQHGADYVIAVGEAFNDKRTIERATTEGVGLLSVDGLSSIVRLTLQGIIGVNEIRAIVSQVGLISEASITKAGSSSLRMMRIARSVISALSVEATGNDTVTQGALSPSDVYMQLRGQSEAPTIDEIQEVLDLLSSPLMRGFARVQNKYVLVDHVAAIAGRLRTLSEYALGADGGQ